MAETDPREYANGARAARRAIADGVPRWVRINRDNFGEFIHPDTGIPFARLSGPPGSEMQLESFARGANDETLMAIESGTINVDYRPLLMTRQEARRALDSALLGELSIENPRLASPSGEFTLEVRNTDSKSDRTTWIRYNHERYGEWPRMSIYDGPCRVAVGREGRVLVFEHPKVYVTQDVATTQVLNTYMRDFEASDQRL